MNFTIWSPILVGVIVVAMMPGFWWVLIPCSLIAWLGWLARDAT